MKPLKAAAATYSLEVNPTNCELFIIRPESDECHNTHELFCKASPGQCEVKLLEKHDLTILGAPILAEGIRKVLTDKIKSLKTMTERLKEIVAHEALFLLRNCFSIPKLTFSEQHLAS